MVQAKSGYKFPDFVLVPCCERQQGDIPGLLDGLGEAPLVLGADAREATGHDLATLGHKAL
jgi:hypothetical protein